MTRTPFDRDNKDFTEDAHSAARKQVYPHLFSSNAELRFENTDRGDSEEHDILDRKLGIDVRVYASIGGFNQPVPLHIQERFRRPDYRDFQDLTITKFNQASGEVSELSKIAAQWIIYGYFEPTIEEVQEAICVNVPVLARRLASGAVGYDDSNSNDKGQDFISISFGELDRVGALAFHLDRTQSVNSPVTIDNRQKITAWCGRGGGADD